MTAVELFSQHHEEMKTHDSQSNFYRNLIPLELPKEGEQYSFEVDLSACTGCKACVTACHSLNGLDENETWRQVGLLQGGTSEEPIQQTVTTACHHCLEPGCMQGCPTKAFEKDVITGIVRHLDDQCIGCQYCILKCPYDVPQYNKSKGIVRKCDMCSDRLAEGEAPACVQSCPNDAIKIAIVNQSKIAMINSVQKLLPETPTDEDTSPTTQYIRKEALPTNALPADFFSSKPKDPHIPLVLGLILTQLSVGVYIGEWMSTSSVFNPYLSAFALICALAAIAASTMHLGRPLYAFRAVLGFKTSWLSREILAFGGFAFFASLLTASHIMIDSEKLFGKTLPFIDKITPYLDFIQFMAIGTGLVGVLCSVMIYHDTKKSLWNFYWTGPKFLLTTAILGTSTYLLISSNAAFYFETSIEMIRTMSSNLLSTIIVLTALKLFYDASLFLSLKDKVFSIEKRSSLMIIKELKKPAIVRVVSSLLGGIVLPIIFISLATLTEHLHIFALLSFILLIIGEFSERYLFFRGIVTPNMPGAVVT